MKTNVIYHIVYATTNDIYDECNPDRDLNVQVENNYPWVFKTKEEAEKQYAEASKMSHDYGRELTVSLYEYKLTDEELTDLESEEDVIDYVTDEFVSGNLIKEDVFDNNHYEPLAGGVVLTWSWHRYIGYARNFVGVEWGERIYNYATRSYAKTEKDLITNNGEYTNKDVATLIIKASEIEGMTEQDKAEYIINEIMSDRWKWNYQYGPSASKIADALGLKLDCEEEEE